MKMQYESIKRIILDCLSNLFIHEDDVILSLYFIQSTNKPAHPNIRRLYYPAGKHRDPKGSAHTSKIQQTIICRQKLKRFLKLQFRDSI